VYINWEVSIMYLIRQAIIAARKEMKLTQEQLSMLSGVPARTIGSIERGERAGKSETLEKLLSALGLRMVICVQNSSPIPPSMEGDSTSRCAPCSRSNR
jgi:transcriptional regulator with XRE-family HTH domain